MRGMVAPCGRGHDVLTAGAGRDRGMLLVTSRTAGEIKDERSELFDEKSSYIPVEGKNRFFNGNFFNEVSRGAQKKL